MADLFRALGRGVMVHFRFADSRDRPWSSKLREGYESRIFQRRFGIDWHFVRLVVKQPGSSFVMCSWEDRTELLCIFLGRLLGRKYLLWTDTPNSAKRRAWWKEPARAAILRFAFRGARAVMGTGAPALQALRRMGCPDEKLVNFPYFINVDAYRLRVDTPGPLRVLSCGRLIYEKGFDLAIRALARYGGDFVYQIAGAGPEEEALRRLAEDLRIGARVRFLGWLEPAAMRELYANNDVFLHPARFEPYGVCVLEAMASGLVVIGSTQTAAIADRITDGVNGFVHKAGNIDAITAKLSSVNLALGLSARKTAEEWPLSRGVTVLQGLEKEP